MKFHKILFSDYLVMAPNGRKERRKDGQIDLDKTISLHLRRGGVGEGGGGSGIITYLAEYGWS